MARTGDFISKLDALFFPLFGRGAYVQAAEVLKDLVFSIENEDTAISDADKAEVYNCFALALKRSGRLCAAKQMYLKANELSQFNHITHLNNLAVCLFELGDYPPAKMYYAKAIDRLAAQGHTSSDMAFYRSNLGTLLMYWGYIDDALKHLLYSYDVYCGSYAGRDYAHTLFRLAHAVFWMGYYDDAVRIAERAMQEMAMSWSQVHPRTAEVQLLYARLLLAVGEPLQAEAQIKSAFSVLKTNIDPDAPMMGRGYLILAECERAHTNPGQKAMQYLRKAFRCFRKSYENVYNPDMADYYSERAELLMRQGKYPGAQRSLARAMRIQRRLFVKTHPVLGHTCRRLGYCYAQLGAFAPARKMYLESLHILRRVHRCHPELSELLGDIAQLYPDRRIGATCSKYSALIRLEKPGLIRQAKQPAIVRFADAPAAAPQPRKVLPLFHIIAVATADMEAHAVELLRKVRAMSEFYGNELPEISHALFVQGKPGASTASFEELLQAGPHDPYKRVLVGLVGREYGKPAGLGQNILMAHPWMTHYRDRSEWELLIRHCTNARTTGTLYFVDKKVSKRDIQNPYLKSQSLLDELKRSGPEREVELKKIQNGDLDDVGFMMFRLNAAFLKTRHLFQTAHGVFH